MKRCLLALCLLYFTVLPVEEVTAQRLDHIQGEMLIQLRPEADMRRLLAEFNRFQGRNTHFRIVRQLQGPMRSWVCRFDHTRIHEGRLLERLRAHPLIENAQFNHFLTLRSTIPDDPDFARQWQYFNTGQGGGLPGADFDIDLAWDFTTGGRTPGGDEIVVCIIDNGVDLDHEDLRDNLWTNQAEIPGNRIDDDENGYIDDYRGWNTALQNDRIDLEPVDDIHGTPVAGIIGARGNNGKGVSGVNWQVRLMVVSGGTGVESEALEAYAYPLAQRRRYNASGGLEGALVVATNASWGRDFVDPSEFPLWCALYDTLGAAGILNIAATSNEEINVDEQGDMPTGCGSDFLIGVTNIDGNNDKIEKAGFGRRSVDLGAYGEDVWTLDRGNRYGRFGGTSAATPHVSGAVALLYGAACSRLQYLTQFDPPAAALLAKDYILRGAVPTGSLENITLTGGRLNILNSLALYLDECSACAPPSALRAAPLDETRTRLLWHQDPGVEKVDLRWRPAGATDWKVVRNVRSPFELEGLSACTAYEVQLSSTCGGRQSDYTPGFFFTSDGCCELPDRFRLSVRNEASAVVQWDLVDGAEAYQLRLRTLETGAEEQITVRSDIAFFNSLDACAAYEVAIRTLCPEGPSSFGKQITLSTLGCGSCLDLPYCTPDGADARQEWIDEVQLHTLEHFSGSDDGYGDFTGLPTTQLARGATYPITITPGFAGQRLFEYHRVWIDYDQDGAFQDTELVFDPDGVSRNPVSGSVEIPADALTGKTRMRVAMKFLDPAGPCGFIDRPFGEYEDYCVFIVEEEAPCSPALKPDTLSVGFETASLQWTSSENADSYLLRYRDQARSEWTVMTVDEPQAELEELSACTTYEVQVKSICGELYGPFDETFTFNTDCTTSTAPQGPTALERVGVFPNPTRRSVTVDLELRQALDRLQLTLFDLNGRPLQNRELRLGAGSHQLTIELDLLPAGVYWLRLQDEQGRSVTRRVAKID